MTRTLAIGRCVAWFAASEAERRPPARSRGTAFDDLAGAQLRDEAVRLVGRAVVEEESVVDEDQSLGEVRQHAREARGDLLVRHVVAALRRPLRDARGG